MNTGFKVLAAIVVAIFHLMHVLSTSAYGQSDPSSEIAALEEEIVLFQQIPYVYGASKYEQKITEAPSSISIVTADEIKKLGYRTLGDILGSLRGFYVRYDRNYEYVGVRGFDRPGDYNSRILLLVDGHRINDAIYDQAVIGTDFPIDVDVIDRVEVIRGPSASLYGTSAFFAIVNVITKRGRDLKGLEVSGHIGSHESYKGRLSYGNRFTNGLEMILSGTFYDCEGQDRLYFKEFDDPATNYGIAEKRDGDRYVGIFSTSTFRDFTLQGAYSSRRKALPTAPWGIVFNDSRNRTIDTRAYVDMRYDHTVGNDLGLSARLYYDHYSYEGEYMYDYAEPGDPPFKVLNKDRAMGDWWGGEVRVSWRFLQRHRFIVGTEYRDNVRQDQENHDIDPYHRNLDDTRSSKVFGVYAQGEYQVFDPLLFIIGVRYDHHDTFGGTTNPRIGLIYSPLTKSTFKLLYGQAFRAPNAYELYYNDSDVSQKANPNLEPERIRTYELVYEQYLGDHVRTVASGYYYKINNLISQIQDPVDNLLVFTNMEEIEAKGLELEAEAHWQSGLEGRISYTLQEARNLDSGTRLTNSPTSLVKISLIAPLLREKLFASTEVRYTGDGLTVRRQKTDEYVVTDVTLLARDIIKGLEVSASMYNVFNEHYGHPGSGEHRQDTIIQDGRTFRLKFTYAF